MNPWSIRPAIDRDCRSILGIWHRGWHDAHHDLVPAEILAYRQPQHFQLWLDECFDRTWIAEGSVSLVGFYALDGTELSKLYVDKSARGSGVAQALLEHAEQTLTATGAKVAKLFCTAGNLRAQRFYERHGWTLTKTIEDALWCPDANIVTKNVATHQYEKGL